MNFGLGWVWDSGSYMVVLDTSFGYIDGTLVGAVSLQIRFIYIPRSCTHLLNCYCFHIASSFEKKGNIYPISPKSDQW